MHHHDESLIHHDEGLADWSGVLTSNFSPCFWDLFRHTLVDTSVASEPTLSLLLCHLDAESFPFFFPNNGTM